MEKKEAGVDNGMVGEKYTRPVSPLAAKSELLRVTMLDSSERIYNLTPEEAEGFVAWFKRPLNTGESCFAISDAVEGGREYLAFDKIISFKVWSLKK